MTDSQTQTAVSPAATRPEPTWYETVLACLKASDVKLVVYVPDRVFTPLIKALHADPFFTTFVATREEEALGIVTGRLDGRHARRAADADVGLCHYSERARLAGGAGPDSGADLRVRAWHARRVQSRPGHGVQDHAAGDQFARIESHTITRQDELAFIIDRSIKQAVATLAPVTFILSPLLTGGKVFEA